MNPTPNEVPESFKGPEIDSLRDDSSKSPTDFAILMAYDAFRVCIGATPKYHTADEIARWMATINTRAPLPASVPTDTPMYHNPANLTLKQIGKGWRPLLISETRAIDGDEAWIGEWVPVDPGERRENLTYRRKEGDEPCAQSNTQELSNPVTVTATCQSTTSASATPASASERSANVPSGGAAERSDEALREICILCGGFDPSDGEGTSPEEVVEYVRAKLASNTPAPAPMGETETDACDDCEVLKKQLAEANEHADFYCKATDQTSLLLDEVTRERAKALADLSALREKADAMAAALKPILEFRKNCDGDIGWRSKPEAVVGNLRVKHVLAAESSLTAYTGKEAK